MTQTRPARGNDYHSSQRTKKKNETKNRGRGRGGGGGDQTEKGSDSFFLYFKAH